MGLPGEVRCLGGDKTQYMEYNKVDILAIGVHPDDIELSCSGTILKHIDMGYSVAFCDLTMGELGTRGSGPLRLKEAEKSRELMGAVERVNLGMRDGFFRNTEENLRKLIAEIRYFKPEIVLANSHADRHPDHGRAAKLIQDACFYAGLVKIETERQGVSQEKWRPSAVYHYIQDRNVDYDFLVDISDYIDKKQESILCFSSQFFSGDEEGEQTPISSKRFLDFIRAKNAAWARDINVDYAEAFKTNRDIGIVDIMKLQ